MEKDKCPICQKKSIKTPCKNCAYILNHGANEETIKKMTFNKEVNKVWQENKIIAKALADTYYSEVLENYHRMTINDSKENYGYNTFVEGINLTMDIAMPLLDRDAQETIKAKIWMMIVVKGMRERKKK